MSTALQNPRYRNRYRQQYVPGRGGYSNAVNYRRETPEPEPSNSPPVQGIYSDHRTAVMLCSFMGAQTTVKTRNGSTYKGHTIGFSDEGDIAMSDVRLDNGDNTQKSCVPGIIIPKDKFVVCKTNGVDLKGLYSSPADFTDSGIVNRINGSSDTPMKELQPWDDEDAVEINSAVTLDDPNERWDSTLMFQANRDKFNLRSTYNEDLHEYTTKLPDPHSEGYEEKEKFAQKQAEAIEQSEAYQSRISKELKDGDEEFLYSAVHRADELNLPPQRHQESNSNSGRNSCIIPTQKDDIEQSLRNEAFRVQGRGSLQPASHPQQSLHSHHQQQIARQMNNQFQGPPPSVGPLNRNMGLATQHPRQQGQQNHAGPHHPHHQQHPPHQYQQQPPPPHPGMQQHILPISQRHQQQRSSPHQQLVPLNQQSNKPHSPHLHLQNLPTTLSSSSSLSSLSQAQHPPHQKFNIHHKQSSTQQSPSIKGANATGPLAPLPSPHEPMRPVSLQTSIEFKNSEVIDQKMPLRDRQQIYHQKPPVTGPPPASSHTGGQKVNDTQLPTSPSSTVLSDAQQTGQSCSGPTSSPQSALAPDRRVGRGMETSPEERNKIGQSLHDFKKNFVLESNGSNPPEALRQEDTNDGSPVSSAPSSSVATTPIMPTPETSLQPTEHTGENTGVKHDRHEDLSSQKSKLNPNAKEFKPKSQPVQVEGQSPSPQPRSSPHVPQMVHYSPQQTVLVPYSYFMANPQIKRATVSLGAGVVSDLAAHQVTGQPLLATQPPNMMYLQATGQGLPTAYQLYSPQIINPRMVGPGSLNMAQAGQVTGMEQMAAQNQPQPVFVTTQQQPLHTPIPAHLHPQPVHAQAIPLQSSIQQSQPVHMPNPVPSPVQHQQQNSQHMPQPLQHHIQQVPPHSSANPQSAHYPQMTVNYSHGIPTVPRTSISGQQSLTAGHSPVSYISGSQFVYNSGTAQYTFAPALQPQATPNSSHGAGPQAQYVIMPQPSAQGHPSLQQHTAQPYTSSSIPFQPQQHLMQVPPHMPPNHNSNPSQSSPHMIHPGMSVGMHQQVSNTQSNMYMHVPSTVHQYQHQQ